MGQGDPTLAVVTDIVRGMAGADGAEGRVDAVLGVVARTVGADLALLLLADRARGVRVIGPGLPEGIDAALARELELSGEGDPLLDPVSRGDLAPRTAQRTFGPAAWAASQRRAQCLRVCDVDQVATLPLAGPPDVVIAMFGRRGADFTDDDLRALEDVRDLAADLTTLAGVTTPKGDAGRPSLTVRETQVLALLARGYTCSRIARSIGSSPRTVEVHLGRIYAKLGTRDRLSAVLTAYDVGLIPPREPAPRARTTDRPPAAAAGGRSSSGLG